MLPFSFERSQAQTILLAELFHVVTMSRHLDIAFGIDAQDRSSGGRDVSCDLMAIEGLSVVPANIDAHGTNWQQRLTAIILRRA